MMGGWAHKRRTAIKAKSIRQKRQIAELVSEGFTVAAAARSIGVSQQRGSQIWRGIRNDLGAQAQ